MTFLKRLLAALALVSLATPAAAQISGYSTTAASNTTVGGISVAEGTAPGNLNDAIRAVMADLATYYSGNGTKFTGNATFGDASSDTVGIGTTSPDAVLGIGNSQGGVRFHFDRSTQSGIFGGVNHLGDSGGLEIFSVSSSTDKRIRFSSGATYAGRTQWAQFDSDGKFQIGGTAANASGAVTRANIYYSGGGTEYGLGLRPTADTTVAINFGNAAGSTVGTIQTTATATSYNTSSDYRLKDITGDLTGSGAFIDALKPKVGTWKADGSRFVGFLAHELQAVSPLSVTGEKDGEEMQAVAYASPEIIANLVAEVKSLRARVAQLEAQ